MDGRAVKSFTSTNKGNIKGGALVKDAPEEWFKAGLVVAVEEESGKKAEPPKKETATKTPKTEKAVKE